MYLCVCKQVIEAFDRDDIVVRSASSEIFGTTLGHLRSRPHSRLFFGAALDRRSLAHMESFLDKHRLGALRDQLDDRPLSAWLKMSVTDVDSALRALQVDAPLRRAFTAALLVRTKERETWTLIVVLQGIDRRMGGS